MFIIIEQKKNLTQGELAARVDRNASAITRIECGYRMMSVILLRSVADALEVSCDALLYGPTKQGHIANINRLLVGRSEAELAKIDRIVRAYFSEDSLDK